MTVTREEIAAFADGELPPAREAEVAASIAADPELAREVEAHRALEAMLKRHLDPIAAAPVPDALAVLLASPGHPDEASVVDLDAARQHRAAKRALPRWSWVVGPALAASLAVVVLFPRGGEEAPGYAEPQLARLLDDRLVAQQAPDDEIRVLLSFRSREGEYCRAFSGSAASGIACRDDAGWRIETDGEGVAAAGNDYRMAGAGSAALMARAQEMAAGAALDAAAEAEARENGWR